ncbi:Hsp70 family protein [Nocardia sp. BMG111209]|uniref:Hsp70 family protein n=1 Tax=Nocardia sp. BMG111209 TaxID=1160137 RepID=UPI0012DCE892|nr:Hsp70 family protein [Nocardia sp. BMG111209]
MSIGTVSTVCAIASAGNEPVPQPVTRRTTLTFDSSGAVRVGRIPPHGRAVTEFADLTRPGPPSARIGRRTLTAADLIATVAAAVSAEALDTRRSAGRPRPSGGTPRYSGAMIAVAHPVGYPPALIADLRTALAGADLPEALLVAEPVAAAAWLAASHGPLPPGLTLVYDLGGSGLTVSLVRIGAGSPPGPVVGVPVRSDEYGGRAFGAEVARRAARAVRAGSAPLTDAATGELRDARVRRSLTEVYRCLRLADVTMADVDRVLVIGGAARPPEVAAVLAETLARPVFVAPDPARTVAEGAALLARRAAELASGEALRRRRARRADAVRRVRRRVVRAAVLVGAAVAAVAMLAVVPGDCPHPPTGSFRAVLQSDTQPHRT